MYDHFNSIWNQITSPNSFSLLGPSPCTGTDVSAPWDSMWESIVAASISPHDQGVNPASNRALMHRMIAEFCPQEQDLPAINELLCTDRLTNFNSSTMQHRIQTREMLQEIANTGLITGRRVAFGFHEEAMREVVGKIGLISASLATLLWVHYALWMVSVIKLGTEKHHRLYEAGGDALDYVGCCMMTEDGHGSDVAGLELRCDFVRNGERGHFLVHTDVPSARKIWAGGLGQIAQRGVLFARLWLPDPLTGEQKDHGGHAFVMELRDPDGQILPGRIIGEMGKWVGRDHKGAKHVLIHANDAEVLMNRNNYARAGQEGREVASIYDCVFLRNRLIAEKYKNQLIQLEASGRVHFPLSDLPSELARLLDDSEIDEGCGRKKGLNGVDNGWICFDQVSIPYDALLDAHCDITAEGEYIGKNGHHVKKAQKLLYTLMEQFVRGRQIISISSAAGFRLLSQLFFCEPPAWISRERHDQTLLHLTACGHALESSLEMILSPDNVNDHIPASGMKAVASWMLMYAFHHVLGLYGDNPAPQHGKLLENLHNFCDDHFATTIYEGPNTVLLQLVARDLATGFVFGKFDWFNEIDQNPINSIDEWEERLLNIPCLVERAITKLRFDIYQDFSVIKPIMLPFVMDPKKRHLLQDVWMSKCALHGHKMSLAFMQMSIIEHFWLAAQKRDAEEGGTLWRDLATYYAEQTLADPLHYEIPGQEGPYRAESPQGGQYYPMPILPQENRERFAAEMRLKDRLPELIASAGIPMKYIGALVGH